MGHRLQRHGRCVAHVGPRVACCDAPGGYYHAIRCPHPFRDDPPEVPQEVWIDTRALSCGGDTCPPEGGRVVYVQGFCYELEPGDIPVPPGCSVRSDRPWLARVYTQLDENTRTDLGNCADPGITCADSVCAGVPPDPCCITGPWVWNTCSSSPQGSECVCGQDYLWVEAGDYDRRVDYTGRPAGPGDVVRVQVQTRITFRQRCATGGTVSTEIVHWEWNTTTTYGDGRIVPSSRQRPNAAGIPVLCGRGVPWAGIGVPDHGYQPPCSGSITYPNGSSASWDEYHDCRGGRAVGAVVSITAQYRLTERSTITWTVVTVSRCPDGNGQRPGGLHQPKDARIDAAYEAAIAAATGLRPGCPGCGA